MDKRSIEISFSPALFNLFEYQESIVVVIDVLRATTAICTAINNGVECVIPVSSVADALEYQGKEGCLLAAERNGNIVKGFSLGNSPLSYIDNSVKGKTLIMTTTNGTKAIEMAKKSHKLAIGSFLNVDSLSKWLIEQDRNVIIFCSGWKNKFNLEDTICGGAISEKLIESDKFETECDSTLAAIRLYELAKNDLYSFLKESSHRKRLAHLNLENDVKYCLSDNKLDVVPVLFGDKIIDVKKNEN